MKVLTNAKIFDFENNKFKDVNIIIDGEKIYKICDKNSDNIAKFKSNDIIDCKNGIVLAGFINSQSYLLENFFFNFSKESDLDIFKEKYNQFVKSLSMEEKYLIYKYQMLNAIKNGITTLCDNDFYNLSLKKAVIESGINFVYKVGFDGGENNFDESLVRKLETTNENYVFALKNVLYNCEEDFSKIIKLSRQYNKPILINGSENIVEAGEVEKNFGVTNIKLLENYGLLDNNHIINNSNVIDKDDYESLLNFDSKLIFSPSYNFNFGYKSANIYALNKQNLIGLSSFNNDYFIELFLARNLEKDGYNSLEVFSGKELLNFASNNAKILELDGEGQIKENAPANLIILETSGVLEISSLIKNFDNRNIKSVFIKGRLVYNNSHFVENKDYSKLENMCIRIMKNFLK